MFTEEVVAGVVAGGGEGAEGGAMLGVEGMGEEVAFAEEEEVGVGGPWARGGLLGGLMVGFGFLG